MDHLPVTYYRLGQPVMIEAYPGQPATVGEITGQFIAIFFGSDLNSAWRLQSVSPEFVKPILRPLSQIRMSHVVELYKIACPHNGQTDKEILEYVANMQAKYDDIISIWADSTAPCLWLLDQYYDVRGLIDQNLAVADET